MSVTTSSRYVRRAHRPRVVATIRSAGSAAPFVAALLLACGVPSVGEWEEYGADRDIPVSDAGNAGKPDIQTPKSCTTNDDCGDQALHSRMCDVPICDLGYCSTRRQQVGHPCDDSNATTVMDSCRADGTCAGTQYLCGDHICTDSFENCTTCPADCGCGANMYCRDGDCLSIPEDEDGVCEKLEDCATSPVDCACPASHACIDGSCMDCSVACAQDHRNCGEFEGCDCGRCTDGLVCGNWGQCAVPGDCGDGECLKDFENCLDCPEDCPCQKGYGCTSAGRCVSCRTSCQGIECGTVDGCDCGTAGVCQRCAAGRIVTDCQCVCSTAGRECGSIGECTCGSMNGGCMDRMKCENGLCMPDCPKVCDDIECGAIGNCLCARCPASQVCYDGGCATVTFDKDVYEPDNYPGQAAYLGEFTDGDNSTDWDVIANILEPEDRDWYEATVEDTWGEYLAVDVRLDGMSEDADLNLMVCYRCDRGKLTEPDLDPSGDVFETVSSIEGARCFESRRRWGIAEHISFDPVCSGGFDDSGTVFVKISPAQRDDARTDYLLAISF